MKFVHELRRYDLLMRGFDRALQQADALHSENPEKSLAYDELSDALWDKAEAVKADMLANVRSAPKGHERFVRRKVFRLSQRLKGIKI